MQTIPWNIAYNNYNDNRCFYFYIYCSCTSFDYGLSKHISNISMRFNPLFIYNFYTSLLVYRLYVINEATVIIHGVSKTTKRLVVVYLPVREL